LKGSISKDVAIVKDTGIICNIEAWDLAQFGAWRMKSTSNINILMNAGIISGGILYSSSSTIDASTVNNMFFYQVSGSIAFDSVGDVVTNGCTFVANSMSSDTTTIINDSVIDADSTINATYNNCVFTLPTPIGTLNDCQVSWVPPVWPVWGDVDFSKGSLNYGTMTSPPKPGIGSPDYAGYDEDLSGGDRNDIGAYTSEAVPTTATPTTATPTTTTLAPTTTTVGPIPVISFKILNISEPVLSAHFSKVTMNIVGVANPENTDVELIAYEYSVDNTTWNIMTTESPITGLTFNPTGYNNAFIWNIKEDLGNSIYNTTINIRFRAQATFSSEILLTDYRIRSVYLVKRVVQKELRKTSVLPQGYSGISGTKSMKNKPK
jgi:hypothetical protein